MKPAVSSGVPHFFASDYAMQNYFILMLISIVALYSLPPTV